MKTCPFCFKEDLVDQATKCPHCATWLTGGDESRNGIEKLRQEMRQEFKDDIKSHRDYLNSLLNRVQWTAGAMLVLVVGAAAFFGIRTDQSITEITAAITDQAETEIREQVRIGGEKMKDTIDEKMKKRIDTELDTASKNIQDAFNVRISELDREAEKKIKEFGAGFEQKLDKKVGVSFKKMVPIKELSIQFRACNMDSVATANCIVAAHRYCQNVRKSQIGVIQEWHKPKHAPEGEVLVACIN